MSRRQRLDASYGRVLGIGLGLSLAAHVAVLGFGRITIPERSAASARLRAVTLAEPAIPLEKETSQVLASASIAVVELGELSPTLEAAAKSNLADYEQLLAMARDADLRAPIVPRPRLEAATAASGLAPIHVLEPIQLASKGGRDLGGRGIGISFGAGCVAPGGFAASFPNTVVSLRGL